MNGTSLEEMSLFYYQVANIARRAATVAGATTGGS